MSVSKPLARKHKERRPLSLVSFLYFLKKSEKIKFSMSMLSMNFGLDYKRRVNIFFADVLNLSIFCCSEIFLLNKEKLFLTF